MRTALAVLGGLLLLAGGWYWVSPGLSLKALGDFEASPWELAKLYARDRLRAEFARQMLPQTSDYSPPLTEEVLLDALADPRAVRMLVTEPYGQWQFAAAHGLPAALPGGEDMPPMPRILETSENWHIVRHGLSGFTAQAADRENQRSNRYHFKRDGIGWRLITIELTAPIA